MVQGIRLVKESIGLTVFMVQNFKCCNCSNESRVQMVQRINWFKGSEDSRVYLCAANLDNQCLSLCPLPSNTKLVMKDEPRLGTAQPLLVAINKYKAFDYRKFPTNE